MPQVASQVFGCADVDVLLSSLHWIYETARRRNDGRMPGLLVDGGANVGRATARWIAAFGDAFGRSVAANSTHAPCIICAGADATDGGGSEAAADGPPHVAVVAVEPSPRNFDLLQRHAQENGWHHEGFVSVRAALGVKTGTAMLAFNDDFAIDEVATLVYNADDARPRQPVQVMTVDQVVALGMEQIPGLENVSRPPKVFLMKLDIEGMEPAVLRAAVRSEALIKFVTFEYSTAVWRESLEGVVADLHAGGFFCFLITPERLLPISPPFWHSAYMMPVWSNSICGHMEDPDLAALVQLHAGAVGVWPMLPNMFLEGHAADRDDALPFAAARKLCVDLGDACGGVTCDCSSAEGGGPARCGRLGFPAPGPCTVRAGETGAMPSPSGEVSFMRDPEGSELFLLYKRTLGPLAGGGSPVDR